MMGKSWLITGGSGRRREKTADEWGILFRDLFLFDHINMKDFEGMIISSVVPPVLDMVQEMAEKYFHVKPLIVGSDIETGNEDFI